MAIVTTDNRYYSEIASAIREKTGGSTLYTPAQMAAAIKSIQAGEAMSIETIRTICYVPSDFEKNYTALEYIQSTGTQYIDTGFKPNQDTKVVMDVESVSGIDHVLFSARTSASSKVMEMIWSNSGGYYRFYYNNGSVNMNGISATPATRRTITVDKNTATIDGYYVSRTYTAFQCECNMVLLARSTLGTIGAYTTGKLYSCQIYDNGILIRDYVPCYRKSDGEVGLYDLVGKKFYANAGTGSFIASPDPVDLPDGYKQLAYIESSGTQYIDTGVKPNQNTRLELKVSVNSGNLFAATPSGDSRFGLYVLQGGRVDIGFGASGYLGSKLTGLSFPATLSLRNGSLTGNGNTATFATQGSFQSTSNLPIFAEGTSASYGEVYYCKIYDGELLVRDFVPCKNPSGVIGLYDMVNETFYTNAGSGSFTGA